MLEYDFQIQYKPGKDNVVSDFLSRNPISAIDISRSSLKNIQARDPLISKLLSDLHNGCTDRKFLALKPFLFLKNGVLFHNKNNKLRIFAPCSIQADILQSAHNSQLGGHMGIFKSRERILEKYYWPSLDSDLKAHIKTCLPCQKTKPHSGPVRPPLTPLEQSISPNHRVHIDLFGPLQTSSSGKKYVMVMTDAFTKYVEIVAIANKEASSVASALMDVWITRYSTPREIVSDNGKEFCNSLIKDLTRRLGILHKTTSPYHPECNASAEVFNRTMKQYIQAVIQPPFLDWEQYLPALRISYNTSVSKATLASPFSLVFGMEPHMPYFDFEPSILYNENSHDSLSTLNLARKKAMENNIVYRQKYARQYDTRHDVQDSSLSLDDKILIAFPPKQKFKNAKLQPLYEGPFSLTKVKPPNV